MKLADKVRSGVLTQEEAEQLLDTAGKKALRQELRGEKKQSQRKIQLNASTEEMSALVFWRIEESSSRSAAIGYLKKFPQWVSHGFPTSPSTEQALSRAATSLRVPGIIFRRSRGKERGLVAVISEVKRGRHYEMAHGATVVPTDEGAGILRQKDCQPDHERAAKKLIEEQKRQLDTVDVKDVSTWLSTVISGSHCGGVALRPKGGLYAIPPGHFDAVETLRDAAAAVGAEIYLVRLSPDQETKAAMLRAQELGLQALCREAFMETKMFVKEAPERFRPRRTATASLRKLDDLHARVALFQNVLGDVAANLAQSIVAAAEETRAAYEDATGKKDL